jgi:hypothetical protein
VQNILFARPQKFIVFDASTEFRRLIIEQFEDRRVLAVAIKDAFIVTNDTPRTVDAPGLLANDREIAWTNIVPTAALAEFFFPKSFQSGRISCPVFESFGNGDFGRAGGAPGWTEIGGEKSEVSVSKFHVLRSGQRASAQAALNFSAGQIRNAF